MRGGGSGPLIGPSALLSPAVAVLANGSDWVLALPGPGGSTEFGSDWAVILRANPSAVLWQ